MGNKKKSTYVIIGILTIVLVVMIAVIVKDDDTQTATSSSTTYTENQAIKTDIENTISSSSYVSTALEEKKLLHNTYYFEEVYVETNQAILTGENILKYTNGEYLVAPYNCVITEMSLPGTGEECTNKHYIVIQSIDTLQMTIKIDEEDLSKISVGQEASIEIEALNKTVTGHVTNISNTATYSSSGSKFNVTVEFENDGEILLGMSAKCSVILEKVEDVIAVPVEAVQESNNRSYVIIKDLQGNTKATYVETGIENDAYIEIKSGLNEGDIVLIES